MPQLPDFIMAELPKVVEGIERSRYFGISGTTIMLYDLMLTFSTEVNHVWVNERRIAMPSLLFMLNRYLPIPILVLNIYASNPLRQNPLTDRFCNAGAVIAVVGWAFNQMSATWLLSLRVISLYSGRKAFVWSIYIVYFVTHGAAVVLGILALPSISSMTVFYTPVNVCALLTPAPVAGIPYFFPLALELYVFILQIVNHYSRNRFRKEHELPSFGLLRTLYLDGYLYFVACMLLRVLTTLMWQINAAGLGYSSNQFEFAMTATLASRFYLHLRKVIQKRVVGTMMDQYTGVSYDNAQFARPRASTLGSLELSVLQEFPAAVPMSPTGEESTSDSEHRKGCKPSGVSRLNSESDNPTYQSQNSTKQGTFERTETEGGVEIRLLK